MIAPGSPRSYHQVYERWQPGAQPVPVEVLHDGNVVATYAPVGVSEEAAVSIVFDVRVLAWARVGALLSGTWIARAKDEPTVRLKGSVDEKRVWRLEP